MEGNVSENTCGNVLKSSIILRKTAEYFTYTSLEYFQRWKKISDLVEEFEVNVTRLRYRECVKYPTKSIFVVRIMILLK